MTVLEPTDDEIRAARAMVRDCKHRDVGFAWMDPAEIVGDPDGMWIVGRRYCRVCGDQWGDRVAIGSDEGVALLVEHGFELIRDDAGNLIGAECHGRW